MDRTKVAGIFTSAPDLHQMQRLVFFTRKNTAVWHHTIRLKIWLRLIHAFQPARPRIFHDLRPNRLRITNRNRIGKLQGFIGQQRGVIPAHHHGHTPRAIMHRKLISIFGGERFHCQRYKIGRLIKRHRFNTRIIKFDLHIRRGQLCQNAKDQRLERICRAACCDVWTDKRNSHGIKCLASFLTDNGFSYLNFFLRCERFQPLMVERTSLASLYLFVPSLHHQLADFLHTR